MINYVVVHISMFFSVIILRPLGPTWTFWYAPSFLNDIEQKIANHTFSCNTLTFSLETFGNIAERKNI